MRLYVVKWVIHESAAKWWLDVSRYGGNSCVERPITANCRRSVTNTRVVGRRVPKNKRTKFLRQCFDVRDKL